MTTIYAMTLHGMGRNADFQKRRGARQQPVDAPRQLQSPPDGLDADAIPSAEELRAAAAAVDTDL